MQFWMKPFNRQYGICEYVNSAQRTSGKLIRFAYCQAIAKFNAKLTEQTLQLDGTYWGWHVIFKGRDRDWTIARQSMQ